MLIFNWFVSFTIFIALQTCLWNNQLMNSSINSIFKINIPIIPAVLCPAMTWKWPLRELDEVDLFDTISLLLPDCCLLFWAEDEAFTKIMLKLDEQLGNKYFSFLLKCPAKDRRRLRLHIDIAESAVKVSRFMFNLFEIYIT